MSRKGHFNGGGTLIGPRDQSWFGTSAGMPSKPKIRSVGLAQKQFEKFKSDGLSPSEWEKEKGSQSVHQKSRKKRK